jgi:hypothetical protein
VSFVPENKTNIVSADGTVANFPQTAGGTPINIPNIVPAGYYLYVTSAFDDDVNGVRGEGNVIAMERTNIGETIIEGRFIEHVYVLGGAIGAKSAEFDDWISMHVKADASAPEDRTGTSDGNANKVALGGGAHIIVPAPLNDGDWNVDGSTLVHGELNADLVPVPSSGGNTGYWHWDPAQDPSIYPCANPAQPDGPYNLFDFPIDPLVRQANRLSFLIPGDITPPTLKGKKILPHWKCVFTMHRNSQQGTLQGACRMTLARVTTA